MEGLDLVDAFLIAIISTVTSLGVMTLGGWWRRRVRSKLAARRRATRGSSFAAFVDDADAQPPESARSEDGDVVIDLRDRPETLDDGARRVLRLRLGPPERDG